MQIKIAAVCRLTFPRMTEISRYTLQKADEDVIVLVNTKRPQDRTIRYKVLKVMQGVQSHPCICEAS